MPPSHPQVQAVDRPAHEVKGAPLLGPRPARSPRAGPERARSVFATGKRNVCRL